MRDAFGGRKKYGERPKVRPPTKERRMGVWLQSSIGQFSAVLPFLTVSTPAVGRALAATCVLGFPGQKKSPSAYTHLIFRTSLLPSARIQMYRRRLRRRYCRHEKKIYGLSPVETQNSASPAQTQDTVSLRNAQGVRTDQSEAASAGTRACPGCRVLVARYTTTPVARVITMMIRKVLLNCIA